MAASWLVSLARWSEVELGLLRLRAVSLARWLEL